MGASCMLPSVASLTGRSVCKLVRMRPNVIITGAQVIDDLFRQGKGAQVSHLSFMHQHSSYY